MLKSILIVDDSCTARMIIRRCLEIAGYAEAEFREAAHGREALNLLSKEPADLILTDLNMPEMNGKTFIRRLKSSPKLFSIPVIVISSITTDREETELREQGVIAVVRKPITPMTLIEVLEREL